MVRTQELTLKPYYKDAWATLYLGDSAEVLPQLPRDSAHLLIVDPPYGRNYQSNMRKVPMAKIQGDDGSLDIIPILRASLRVLKVGRHVYVFGPADLSNLQLSGTIKLIWDKALMSTGDLRLPWAKNYEEIQFAVHSRDKTNRGDGNLTGRLRQSSILRHYRLNSHAVTLHPNQKPVPLLRRFIESSSNFGEIVLDPFAGVGSTLVAATLEGRKSIGIEIDEKYCEITANRLSSVEFQEIA
jgi:site-specific DNA-methyltransferase (adenine-specific)